MRVRDCLTTQLISKTITMQVIGILLDQNVSRPAPETSCAQHSTTRAELCFPSLALTSRGYHKQKASPQCGYCDKTFKSTRGFFQHENSCRAKREHEWQDQQAIQTILEHERESRRTKRENQETAQEASLNSPSSLPSLASHAPFSHQPDSPALQHSSPLLSNEQPLMDDIKVEYHPKSGHGTKIFHFNDYFKKHTVSIDYKNEELKYDVLVRDTEQLLKLLIEDPKLGPKFQWNARRMSKWFGEKWESFWEPERCTRSYVWDVQSELPEGSKPLGIYLYADKNKLFTFGTQKGYPVVMRITNLEAQVRHGCGLGGGHIVGFLPLIDEDAEHTGKTSFANLKRKVWHAAVGKIIEPLMPLAKACMCHIRGNNCLKLCPVGKVSHEELKILEKEWPERAVAEAQEALSRTLAGECEQASKDLGLRTLRNITWDFSHTDSHKARSFNELHYCKSGVFGYHCLKELKAQIKVHEANGQSFNLDKTLYQLLSIKQISHWQNLTILRMASHRSISQMENPREYTLLWLICNYTKCKTLAGLEVHTESTLQALEDVILSFGAILNLKKEYDKYGENDAQSKDWNVIKIYIQKHIKRDVCLKYTLLSMTTKQSEKFHGPMRKNYLNRTNFKHVIEQKSRHKAEEKAQKEKNEAEGGKPEKEQETTQWHQIYLEVPYPSISFSALERAHTNDPAFDRFRIRLNKFLHTFLNIPENRIASELENEPDNYIYTTQLTATDTITECWLLQVDYKSTVTWELIEDKLRCSPDFHGHLRYDTIIFRDGPNTFTFAWLVSIFICQTDGHRPPVALVQPFDVGIGG
ncbi:uncharacterized protein PHACADRAFT_33518 [Phanerochaete carnosa HHB-10118-sp]|uniref:Uncharacterized protein n=1 Tax=Phanerochaete carnosa (strain HHB-10118-sp) TaxID=650164 RepID=K5VRH5_PHACS|nr:uncharacterized protein PHACADRAFT_33518 [Phanerochaete carnosa HHB-10118-sp]EKM49340.1 hypothetical protein PHACADRAFT_33518 [Phanerochaete carnosa HHB-10118-sp]